MTANFEFRDGALFPIPDPIKPGEGDVYEEELKAHGLETLSGEDALGGQFGANSIEILGPAEMVTGDDFPYEWAVSVTFNGAPVMVWCRTFIELQAYLVSISPLITATCVDAIRKTVENAHEWLFSDERGLFRDHVKSSREDEWLRRLARKDRAERKRLEPRKATAQP